MAQRLAPTAARTRGWSSPIRAATVWGSVQIPAPTRRSRVVGAGRRFLTPPSRNHLTLPLGPEEVTERGYSVGVDSVLRYATIGWMKPRSWHQSVCGLRDCALVEGWRLR